MVIIESYREEWADDFKDLNIAWLEKYFIPECYDVDVLSNPHKYILDKGGDIYFVVDNGNPVGTVALMYNQQNELELTKMAVDESHQGKGYGNLLMQHCIEQAKEKGEKELILYSNTKLTPAITMYRKFGFEEVPVGATEYERCNIKMVKQLL